MLPLPVPKSGGSINDLREFFNVQSDGDFISVCAFILCSFNPHGPFLILLINGEAGSAKSTLCRLVRALVDPNKAPLRCEPKDNRDLAIAGNNAWLVGLDNMSRIGEALSNALCRMATGGGFATRELFTDGDEALFDAKRPVMINGIGEVAERSDLIDRAMRLTLPTLPMERRQTEREIWAQFERRRPAILGAFLDAVVVALRNRETVRFDALPRMADCATWVVAAESACPWQKGKFLAALEEQRQSADEFVIEASIVGTTVRHYLHERGDLGGTATQLLDLLAEYAGEKIAKRTDWPKGAPAFGTRLHEVAPNLRRVGIDVQFDRDGRRRNITIRKNKEPETLSSLSPPSPSEVKPPFESAEHDSEDGARDSDSQTCDGDGTARDSDRTASEG